MGGSSCTRSIYPSIHLVCVQVTKDLCQDGWLILHKIEYEEGMRYLGDRQKQCDRVALLKDRARALATASRDASPPLLEHGKVCACDTSHACFVTRVMRVRRPCWRTARRAYVMHYGRAFLRTCNACLRLTRLLAAAAWAQQSEATAGYSSLGRCACDMRALLHV
jgi:hypothetical protein